VYGGAVKIMSGCGTIFDNCSIVDCFSFTATTTGAYYIGQGTPTFNSWTSIKTSFLNCNRDLQFGTNSQSAIDDIFTESTCDTTTVVNYSVRDIPGVSTFVPQFDFQGSTNVVVINCPDANIKNPAFTGVNIGPNGNVNFTGSLTGATVPPVALPSDQGYLAWTFDPSALQGNTQLAQNGNLYVATVYLRTAQTGTDIVFWLDVVGTGLVAGQNFVGIWNSSGQLLNYSVDQTANWSGSPGVKTAVLVEAATPPYFLAGAYWVGLIGNQSGGSLPHFGRATGGLSGGSSSQWPANAGTSAGSSRYGAQALGWTGLSNFTPNQFGSTNPITLWAAIK
jgi:hypothetical protein